MNDDLFKIFDSWEPIIKARKAKGLDKWEKLKPIAAKLQGKGIQAISFTCCHPSHTEPVKHVLGSIEGNLHFLMGYANPNFHFAPYQVSILDPNIPLEDAEEAYKRLSHPSNPSLWAKAAFTAGPEGDLEEGQAHPQARKEKADKDKEQSRQEESVPAKSPTGSYTCVPSEGLVYGDHNGHVYRWDMAKDTFFSYFNPEATEVMNNAAISKSQSTLVFKSVVPEEVLSAAREYRGSDFTRDVWPLVKSKARKPGTILPLESEKGESLYGVITDSSLDFYSRGGERIAVTVFDRAYKSFDLTRDGNVPPASLLALVVNKFDVNEELLNEVLNTKS